MGVPTRKLFRRLELVKRGRLFSGIAGLNNGEGARRGDEGNGTGDDDGAGEADPVKYRSAINIPPSE